MFIKKYGLIGNIPEIEPLLRNTSPSVPGFYVIGITISEILNVSYDILPFLPIQIIPLSILFYSIFNNINCNKIMCALIVLVITSFENGTGGMNFWVHGMGFLSFLVIVFSIIIMKRSNDTNVHIASFIVIIISIISLNYVSYKVTVWTLLFLAILLFIEFFEYYFIKSNHTTKPIKNLRKSLMNTSLIGIIITLSFNKFVYENLIPVAIHSGDLDPGINRILMRFFEKKSDLLSLNDIYYYYPEVLNYIVYIRLFLIFLILVICIIKVFRTYIKRDLLFFDKDHSLFLGFFLTSLGLLIMYNSIGLFDIGLLTYAGLIAILFLHAKYDMKKLIYMAIAILIILNMSYQAVVFIYEIPQSNNNYFEYITPSINWYISYGIESNYKLKSDVLTEGYYDKELINKNITLPQTFTVDDVLFLTKKNAIPIINENTLYVINYKEKRMYIENFKILKPPNNFIFEIETNQKINKIYSSSDISIYSFNKYFNAS